MIYLIGGAPRCGKTTTAKQLSKKLNIPWLATDTLESVVQAYTPTRELSKKFPKNTIRKKTKYSNDLMYTKYTAKQIISSYVKQAKATWLAIETIINCELYEDRSIIIEGHHVHPELVKKLSKKYGSRNVRGAFIGRRDVGNIEKNSTKFPTKNDWFVNRTKNKAIYPKIANMIVGFSKFYERETKKYNQKFYNTDNNFKNKLLEVQRYLIK